MHLIGKIIKGGDVFQEKEKKDILCENCKMMLLSSEIIRCPRCFTLLKHTCSGCGSCNH